jgi:hypothetical protein
MAMTEHAVSLLVRGGKASLNPEELAFMRIHDEQTASRNVNPSQIRGVGIIDGFQIRKFELLRPLSIEQDQKGLLVQLRMEY